mgnify:FL=1
MSYRVGTQCVETQLAADDLILSQQPPTLTADGQLIRPIRKEDGWYLQHQKIQLSHPPCDEMAQMQSGMQYGSLLILLAAVVFGFKAIINLIKGLTSVGARDDN